MIRRRKLSATALDWLVIIGAIAAAILISGILTGYLHELGRRLLGAGQ